MVFVFGVMLMIEDVDHFEKFSQSHLEQPVKAVTKVDE